MIELILFISTASACFLAGIAAGVLILPAMIELDKRKTPKPIDDPLQDFMRGKINQEEYLRRKGIRP